ncbi:MAG: type IV secretory system conjugative DNA transfer family protein, partial [Pirellulaceae bacterium]
MRFWAQRRSDADIVRRQLAAAFPGSSFQEVSTDLPCGDFVLAAALGLGRPDAIPLPALVGPAAIRVGTSIDPVAGVLAVLDDVRNGERVLFQIVVERGAAGRWGSWAREFLNGVDQSRRERVPDGSSIWDLFSQPPDPMRKLATERLAEAVKVKLGDLLFRATVRLLATGPSRERVLELFRGAVAPLTGLSEAGLNELVPLPPDTLERVSDGAARRSLTHEVLLSAHDCISLWHPAHQGMGAGRGAIIRGVDLPAPAPLLEEGVLLGYASPSADAEAVRLPLRDLRQHMVVLGATGTGKSTLVLSMLLDVIARGEGAGLIEGKGDLSDELLGRISEHRLKDVIVIDPLDPDTAVGIDLFGEARRIDLDVAADFVTSVFQLQYADSWGVVFPRLMRASIRALLEVPNTTLLDLPLFLRDRGFRAEILAQVEDASVQGFFADEFERLPPSRQLQAMGPILARVGAALESAFGRYLFGQSASVSLRQAMDAHRIVIARYPRGAIGIQNADLFCGLTAAAVQLAAMSRIDQPERERGDWLLVCDEFQNYASESFTQTFSEGRAYGLGLVVCTQFLGRIPPDVRSSLLGNAAALACFRMGEEDAGLLARRFEPTVSRAELTDLDNYLALVRATVGGQRQAPFSLHVRPPEAAWSPAVSASVRDWSQKQYGRPKVD